MNERQKVAPGPLPAGSKPRRKRKARPLSPEEKLEPSRAPSRPGKRKPRKRVGGTVRLVSGMLTALVVMMLVAGAAAGIFYQQLHAPGPLTQALNVTVPRGAGSRAIAAQLESQGVIHSRWAFILAHLYRRTFTDRPSTIKAGEFSIGQQASIASVLDTLVAGRAVLYKVTIPEGLTSLQAVGRLRDHEFLVGEIVEIPPEGSLLPDTYTFSKGADRLDVLNEMRAAQKKFLTLAWPNRADNLPFGTIDEALILASIVEKETGVASERELVAGVFVNRMRKRMRLQSDPTIIYGIVAGKGSLGRPIYRKDIKQKTPYNTYQIDGLPPTPICNPGREAIAAVLNPAPTKALYFVADGTGGHKFSETLREHNAAVAKWRRIERAAKARKPARADAGGAPVRTLNKRN